jgi:hypothetical protein
MLTAPNLLTLTLLRMLMGNSSIQTTRPMTQRPDKLPLLPMVVSGAGISHVDLTRAKDPRPLTNARWDLFPNLKSTNRPTFVNRHYSDDKWTQLTPAEKQKIWQLRNPGKTPGTGPTRHDRRRAVALTLTSSASPGGPSKRSMEDPAIKSNQLADDQGWGRNRENPFLSRQVRPRGNDN